MLLHLGFCIRAPKVFHPLRDECFVADNLEKPFAGFTKNFCILHYR